MRFFLLTCICFSSVLALHADGQLELYSEPTQIGTVARRTFTNENELPAKIIYYRSKRNLFGPAIESDIYPYEIQLYIYRGHNETWRGFYSEDFRLLRSLETEYDEDDQRKTMRWRDADGIVRYIILSEANKVVSHLYFDDAGSKIIRVKGKLPPDVDPTTIKFTK